MAPHGPHARLLARATKEDAASCPMLVDMCVCVCVCVCSKRYVNDKTGEFFNGIADVRDAKNKILAGIEANKFVHRTIPARQAHRPACRCACCDAARPCTTCSLQDSLW